MRRLHVGGQGEEAPVPDFPVVADGQLLDCSVAVVYDVGEGRLDLVQYAPGDGVQEVDVADLAVDLDSLNFLRVRHLPLRRVLEARRLHDDAVAVAILVVAYEVHRHAVADRNAPRRVRERLLDALVCPAVAAVACDLVDEAAVCEGAEVKRVDLVGIDLKGGPRRDALRLLVLDALATSLHCCGGGERLQPLRTWAGVAFAQRCLGATHQNHALPWLEVENVVAVGVGLENLAVSDHSGAAPVLSGLRKLGHSRPIPHAHHLLALLRLRLGPKANHSRAHRTRRDNPGLATVITACGRDFDAGDESAILRHGIGRFAAGLDKSVVRRKRRESANRIAGKLCIGVIDSALAKTLMPESRLVANGAEEFPGVVENGVAPTGGLKSDTANGYSHRLAVLALADGNSGECV